MSRRTTLRRTIAGAKIDRVVVDVAGEPFVDHEKEVLAYLARD
jgi:arylsulfatase